jgi:hypothetical protein
MKFKILLILSSITVISCSSVSNNRNLASETSTKYPVSRSRHLSVGVCRNDLESIEKIKYLKIAKEISTDELIEIAQSKMLFLTDGTKFLFEDNAAVLPQLDWDQRPEGRFCKCEPIAAEYEGNYLLDKKLYEALSHADQFTLLNDLALGMHKSGISAKCRYPH